MPKKTPSLNKRLGNSSCNFEKYKNQSIRDYYSCHLSIGTHTLDIPESIANNIQLYIKRNKSLPSLFVTRVWIEKKKDGYAIHMGDIDEMYKE